MNSKCIERVTNQEFYFKPNDDLNLNSLFKSNQKFCILAGSGISLDPPSNLLTGFQFTESIIKYFIPKIHQSNILNLTKYDRDGMRDDGDFLRFEQLIEYLTKYDPDLRVLDYFSECKIPNQNHLFLAQMLLQNHIVMTTNFDCLIEHALQEVGVPLNKIHPIINDVDWELEEPNRDDSIRIFKLHGSILNIRTQTRCLDSLKATIKQISGGEGQLFQLEQNKRKVVEEKLKKYDLIVLGYSGLDDFDVGPTLWNIPSNQRIIWIKHNQKVNLKNIKIESIFSRKRLMDAKPIIKQDRNAQYLLKFISTQSREAINIFRITVNTEELIRYLWNKYTHEELKELPRSIKQVNFQDFLAILKLSEPEKWALTGKIYNDRSLLNESKIAYLKAIEISDNNNELEIKADCLSNLGWVLNRQLKKQQAMEYFRKAEEIYEKLPLVQGHIVNLNMMGVILTNNEEYEKALEVYEKAFRLSIQIDDLQLKAISLNNIGHVHGNKRNIKLAMDCFQQAFIINKEIGELHALGDNLINIADSYYNLRNFSKAKKKYKEAMEIGEKIGSLSMKGTCLPRIAQVLNIEHDIHGAIRNYKQALSFIDQLGTLASKFHILSRIGDAFQRIRQFKNALHYFLQAEQLFDQIRDDHLIKIYPIVKEIGKYTLKVQLLNNIGIIYGSLGENQEGLKFFKIALQYLDKVRKPEWIGASYQNLGWMYYNMKKHKKALHYLNRALKIFEEEGLTQPLLQTRRHIQMVKNDDMRPY